MSLDWTEKHRPTTLDDVLGNPKAVKDLRVWASSWIRGSPKKKALILAGTPGIGKTTSAYALAKDFDWGVIELNASDTRNYTQVKKIATSGAINQTFADDWSVHPSAPDFCNETTVGTDNSSPTP